MESRFCEMKTNPGVIDIGAVPVLDYRDFTRTLNDLMTSDSIHCLTYFAIPADKLRFYCWLADDSSGTVFILSHEQSNDPGLVLDSLTPAHFLLHIFEREIHEDQGVGFSGHPWLKPVRY